jgi:hypothetical protein
MKKDFSWFELMKISGNFLEYNAHLIKFELRNKLLESFFH